MAPITKLRSTVGRRLSPAGTCLAMLAACALLAGCGSAGNPAPTQAQFAAHANAICVAGLRSATRLKAPKSTAELLSFSEQTSAIVARLAHELHGVQAPTSAQAHYNHFVKSVAREAQLLEDAVAGLRARNAVRARQALEALSSNAANEEAKALGISDCARTVSPG
ncbi:MAG TPA: hypothetical protein VK655_09275 [Solirubrobacteraceae bacterium]|jgi:hypothetical protein|nr:hypothetical protein [Solirubrobacteraceae bacterium]